MNISIITLFPDMFTGPFGSSIIKRALDRHLIDIRYINLRTFATDRYKSVDDHPYGGGTGMVLRVDVLDRAITETKQGKPAHTVLMDPQGTPYTQQKARALTAYDHLILVCGHYEGIDERVRALVDEEISIGDYVLTGGEIPAMVIVDSVTRLLPGVLKRPDATTSESFESGLLEYPHYTRPETHGGVSVPEELLTGNHKQIAAWRTTQSALRTRKRRPDLSTGKTDPT